MLRTGRIGANLGIPLASRLPLAIDPRFETGMKGSGCQVDLAMQLITLIRLDDTNIDSFNGSTKINKKNHQVFEPSDTIDANAISCLRVLSSSRLAMDF